MHDLDRIQLEGDFEEGGLGMETFNYEFESEAPRYIDLVSPFNEIEEMELASQFLEITDEAELDYFLGNLIKKAAKAVGGFIKSPAGKALGGFLKTAAKKALPVVGGAVGTYFGGPIGAKLGSKLGSMAGNLFELELEGLSQEDMEFEVARRYVQLAGAAAAKTAKVPSSYSPVEAAKSSFVSAAKKYAPGMLRTVANPLENKKTNVSSTSSKSGRWIRKGTTIVLFGA